jgi:enediyne biosynthesis protein E4
MPFSRRELLRAATSCWTTSALYSRSVNPSDGPSVSSPFVEISPAKSGITWVHDNALSDDRQLPETMGPGVAFLDFDNDGWMDIFLVNSGEADFYQPPKPLRNALYKNNRDGTFSDVTERAGVAGGKSFGMGVAVGDYNNDGFPDMFVSAYGRSTLYHNNGDGTFSDVTEKAGLVFPNWATSAVWFDYDNDGLLDLFACSFVRYNKTSIHCGDNKLGRAYFCIPRVFLPSESLLFRNNGDGTFTETGKGTDIGKSLGKALGVVATDLNNDGRMDLFVANDTVQNFLFMNRGGGKWEEIALAAEVGFSENGQARSGMGVDAADIDGRGREDLFVANVDQEMYALYKNLGNETFLNAAHQSDIAKSTRYLSGWGLKFFDYDNDGLLDLMLANGHPDDMIDLYSPQVRYKEPLLLFHNDGKKLLDVSLASGEAFQKPYAARGLAIGDYDNDGRLDVMIANNGSAPVLLHNNAGEGHHWAGFKLIGKTCNRDAIGARLTWSVKGAARTRLKNSGGSYLSSHDAREVIGLGSASKLDWLEIRWPAPSKRRDRLTDLPIDRYVTITEGGAVS